MSNKCTKLFNVFLTEPAVDKYFNHHFTSLSEKITQQKQT